jgi:hypothetical protein
VDRHHRKIRLQLTKNSNPHSDMLPVHLAANARAVFVPDFAASGEAIKTLKDFPLDRGRATKTRAD